MHDFSTNSSTLEGTEISTVCSLPWPRKAVLPKTRPSWRLDLGFPASRTTRHRFPLLISYQVCTNVLEQLELTERASVLIFSFLPLFTDEPGEAQVCVPASIAHDALNLASVHSPPRLKHWLHSPPCLALKHSLWFPPQTVHSCVFFFFLSEVIKDFLIHRYNKRFQS